MSLIRDARFRLAVNVRRLRMRQGLSQEELASRAEVDRSYLSTLERGEHALSLDNLARIAGALKVDPSTLLRKPPPEWQGYSFPRRKRADRRVGPKT